jgi:cytochrome o ubiquinol oxidase subunit 2
MKKLAQVIVPLVVLAAAVALIIHALPPLNFELLNPKGIVALKERNLMLIATALMLVIVLPVFGLTIAIAWRYRASNTQAKYTPDWDHNRMFETIWWGFPCAIILVISIITWQSTHALDPSKQVAASGNPMTIQVIALDWKWLFIYPEQHIATLNYVEFPKDTPVNFVITGDAPMNSFWIPQLGGQIYAMAGMTTHLSLMASTPGDYRGSSANLSGAGFAGMKFTAKAATTSEFDSWVQQVQTSRNSLIAETYDELAKPSSNNPTADYAFVEPGIYDRVVMKYMMPTGSADSASNMVMP